MDRSFSGLVLTIPPVQLSGATSGCKSKAEIIGKTVRAFFPTELADVYAIQDRQVLSTGRPILEKLELHLYIDRRPGWCLTSKIPLRNAAGRVHALAGLSRDLAAPDERRAIPGDAAEAIEFLQANFDQPISTAQLAAKAGLSPLRFGRLVKRIFHLTPGQLIIQTRLQEATRRLRDTDARVAEIALACGFYDHSAFARQFKAATGVTALAYRQSVRRGRRIESSHTES